MAWNITTSRQTGADLEVLRHQVNTDVTASVVLDASTVVPDVNGDRILKAGTPLMKNSNNQYQRYTSSTAPNNVQTLAIDAAGGTYTLTHSGQTTAAIDWDATAAEVGAALELLSTITDVEVTGTGDADDPYIITFQNPSEAAAITSTATNLTGGASTATVSRAAAAVAGILCRTERFPDGTIKSDLPSAMWCHGQWFRPDRIVDWATLGTDIKAALPTCKFL